MCFLCSCAASLCCNNLALAEASCMACVRVDVAARGGGAAQASVALKRTQQNQTSGNGPHHEVVDNADNDDA